MQQSEELIFIFTKENEVVYNFAAGFCYLLLDRLR